MKIKKLVFVWSVVLSCISFPLFAASDLESGVQDLAKQISRNMIDNNKKKIAVIEFSDLNDEITHFGQFLSEELITNLFLVSPGQFEVVERRQLVKVLNEHELDTSGLLDADAMGKVGKLLGVDAIVTGSVTDLGNNVKINARLISVDSAKIFAVAQTSVAKVGTVDDLMKKMVVSNSNNHSEIKGASVDSGGVKSSQSLTANGLSFTVDECVRKSDRIDCVLTVKAVDNDNIVTVYGNYGVTKTVVYDDVGSARVASLVDIGGNKNRTYIKRTLVASVSNKLKLQFKGVSTAAQKVTLLQIKYHSSNNNQSDIAEFRDVTLGGL